MKNKFGTLFKIFLGYLFSLAVVICGIYVLWYSINYQKELATKIFNTVGGILWVMLGCIFGPLIHACITCNYKVLEEDNIKEETLKAKAFDIIVRKHVNIKGFIDCANYVEYNVKYGGTILTYLTNDEFKLINMLILDKVVGDFADVLRRS
jgi:hypothetical protein